MPTYCSRFFKPIWHVLLKINWRYNNQYSFNVKISSNFQRHTNRYPTIFTQFSMIHAHNPCVISCTFQHFRCFVTVYSPCVIDNMLCMTKCLSSESFQRNLGLWFGGGGGVCVCVCGGGDVWGFGVRLGWRAGGWGLGGWVGWGVVGWWVIVMVVHKFLTSCSFTSVKYTWYNNPSAREAYLRNINQ